MALEDKSLPFKHFGVEFIGKSGDERISICPWCFNKKKNFYVNSKTGDYCCHAGKCEERGPIERWLFLVSEENRFKMDEAKKFAQEFLIRTPNKLHFEKAVLAWHIGYCPTTQECTWPVKNEEGNIVDIRRQKQAGMPRKSTPSCKSYLYGTWRLAQMPKGSTVFILGGESDTVVLSHLIYSAGCGRDTCAVGLPGEGVFKKEEWQHLFEDKDFIIKLCLDNDIAGEKGTQNVLQKLAGLCKEFHVLQWSKNLSKGYDVRTWVNDQLKLDASGKKLFVGLEALCKLEHNLFESKITRKLEVPSFKDLYNEASQILVFDKEGDLRLTMETMFATALASRVPVQSPPWFYIVGPPGCGKTELAEFFRCWRPSIMRDGLTPPSLCSGKETGEDPSLLPRLKCKLLIIKDMGLLLSQNAEVRAHYFAIMRGAFDGHYAHQFGSMKQPRDYTDIYFTQIACSTEVIEAPEFQQSRLGERFLTLRIFKNAPIDQMATKKAMEESEGTELPDYFKKKIVSFLNQDLTVMPAMPIQIKNQIALLAEACAPLRREVKWSGYSFARDIDYIPSTERPNRLAQQLGHHAKYLAKVLNKKIVDEDIYNRIVRYAYDSCIPDYLLIVERISRQSIFRNFITLFPYKTDKTEELCRSLEVNNVLVKIADRKKKGHQKSENVLAGYALNSKWESLYKASLRLSGRRKLVLKGKSKLRVKKRVDG